MENNKEKDVMYIFFTLPVVVNVVLVLCVLLYSFYFFYHNKDFDFIVETPCNKDFEVCYIRDCTNPENCPPNQLSSFKKYIVKAKDYKFCINEDCTTACATQQIECIAIDCQSYNQVGESCSGL